MEIEKEREKGNINKDVEDMLRKEVEKSLNLTPVEVVNILFGIYANDGRKSAYYRYL
jgi:hypothetical protein